MDVTPAADAPLQRDRLRLDRDAGTLVGSRCPACGTTSWPQRAVCHRCGNPATAATAFAPTGTLLTHTTVHVDRPGLASPYCLGQVHLDGGPLVFGHVRPAADGVPVPAPVRVVLDPDPSAVPPFWFEVVP